MFWTYVEQLGRALGVATAWVASSLTVANAVTLVSTWVALFLARRFGQHRPQILGLIGTVVLLASWPLSATPTDFAVRVFLWFQIQAICIVHQISLLGTLDRSGRLVALLPAAQGMGQCAGPCGGSLAVDMGLRLQGPAAGAGRSVCHCGQSLCSGRMVSSPRQPTSNPLAGPTGLRLCRVNRGVDSCPVQSNDLAPHHGNVSNRAWGDSMQSVSNELALDGPSISVSGRQILL